MKSEDEIQQLIQMEAPKLNSILLRNNSGALRNATGRMIRFGLGNNSDRKNENFKSSDLIGITSVVITPEMVGQTIGVFTAVEVKKENWKPFQASNTREVGQGNFIDFVNLKGGFGFFSNDVDGYRRAMMESVNKLIK